jgi:hypothetical protein
MAQEREATMTRPVLGKPLASCLGRLQICKGEGRLKE